MDENLHGLRERAHIQQTEFTHTYISTYKSNGNVLIIILEVIMVISESKVFDY